MSVGVSDTEQAGAPVPWQPERALKECDALEVHFSRGFLRSRPERWFPGFAALWLPLAHSLGIEVQLVEVKPLLHLPPSLEFGFGALVDGESFGILFDATSARIIVDSVAPGSQEYAERTVLQYIARRFVYSLTYCWSAADGSKVEFDGILDPLQEPAAGAVKLTVMINNNYCTLWAALGEKLTERLDGLWRRQIHSQVKTENSVGLVSIEIARVQAPGGDPLNLSLAGTQLDLGTALSDQVVLRLDGKTWLPARLGVCHGYFVIESIAGAAIELDSSENSSTVSVELGRISLDEQKISELSQPGAYFQSSIEASPRIKLFSQDREIASGTLSVLDGQFVVEIG